MVEEIMNLAYDVMEEAFDKVMKDIGKNVYARVESNIYGTPESSHYDRIGDFKRAIANFNYDPKELEWDDFFYNQAKIRSLNGKKGMFGHHKSFPWNEPYPDNETVKEYLPLWLNNGWKIFKNRHRGYKFLPYRNNKQDTMETILEKEGSYVTKKFAKECYKILKKRGLLKDGATAADLNNI